MTDIRASGSRPFARRLALVGLTAASAGLVSLAFPDRSWLVLGWVGVAPFLVALGNVGVRGALGLGLVWALAFSVAVGHWLPGGMSLYFDQPLGFGWLCFFAMVGVMVAPFVMAFAASHVLLARRHRQWLPPLVAAAWVAAEWGRGALFTGTGRFIGNPWALLGYSQASQATLVQIASLTGVYGVSFVLMVVNATVAQLAVDLARGRFGLREAAFASGRAAAPALAALAFGWSVLSPLPDAGPRPADATTVAVVQGHIGLAERWHRYFHGRNLETYLRLSNDVLGSSGAEIVVWPEAAMTFVLDDQPEYRSAIASLLEARDAQLISGIPRRIPADGAGESGQAERYYNSVFLFSRDGDVLGHYDKRYLLPFAEYLPFGRLPAGEALFGRFRAFSRGDGEGLLPTRAGPAGVLVCNEAVLPEAARARAREGAVFLVNPSNDSWSRHPMFTAQWFDIVRFRAIEQRRYLVRASTSGPSAIIDPWGRVLSSTQRFARDATAAPIEPRHELSVYGRVGDLFSMLCAASVVVGLVAASSSRSASRGTQSTGPEAPAEAPAGSGACTGLGARSTARAPRNAVDQRKTRYG